MKFQCLVSQANGIVHKIELDQKANGQECLDNVSKKNKTFLYVFSLISKDKEVNKACFKRNLTCVLLSGTCYF